MPKKKIEVRVDTTMQPEVKLVWDQVLPLELNVDFNRQDLNEAFKKVETKLNEVIKKLN